MHTVFVNTQNVRKLEVALDELQSRGAEETCYLVIEGDPGLGKTRATMWLAAHNKCIFVRAKKKWDPSWMYKELIEGLGGRPARSFKDNFSQLIKGLSSRDDLAKTAGDLFFIVIDEADHISRSEIMMESLRDISDFVNVVIVLVGMGRVRTNIRRYPQIASRVTQYVDFHPLSIDDTRKLVTELCEVPVKDDLIVLMHKLSKGYVRELKEAIARVERFGKGQGDGFEVGKAEMVGHVLMNDRATSKPLLVRE